MSCGVKKCGCRKVVCTCEPITCGCETMGDARCILYTGRNLDTLHISNGDSLDSVLHTIDDKIQDLEFLGSNVFSGNNIGGKTPIYSGKNANDVHEFRTLEVSRGLKITHSDTTIRISIDEEYLKEKFLEFSNGL